MTLESLHFTDIPQHLWPVSLSYTLQITFNVYYTWVHDRHDPQYLTHRSLHFTDNPQCLWHVSPYTLTNNSQCLLHMSPWQTWSSICVTRESIHFFRHGRQCLWTVRCQSITDMTLSVHDTLILSSYFYRHDSQWHDTLILSSCDVWESVFVCRVRWCDVWESVFVCRVR